MAGDNLFPSVGVPQANTGGDGLPGATERSVYTQTPSGPSPAEFLGQINYKGVEAFGAAVGDTIDKVIDAKAKEAGTQAVTRDPTTGELTVDPHPGLLGFTAAYKNAVGLSFGAQGQSDMRDNALAFAQQHPDDPQAFQKSFAAWSKGFIAKAPPEARLDLTLTASQESSRFSEGIFKNKATKDIADSRGAVDRERQSAEDQLLALSHNDGVDTPDYTIAKTRWDQNTASLRANPLFQYSAEDEAKDRGDLAAGMYGQAVIGHALKEGKNLGEQAGLDLLHQGIWKPDVALTVLQRQSIESQGRAQIREDAATGRQQLVQDQQELLYKLDDAKAMAASTGDYSKIMKDSDLLSTFGPYRGGQMVESLHEGTAVYGARQMVKLATPAQLAQQEAALDPSRKPPAPDNSKPGVSLDEAIFGQESNFGANTKTSVTGAAGPMQLQPATFARYAHPGEKIDNYNDNIAVGHRIVEGLMHRYYGDASRVAVAYFSGEGNVAPLGSSTPYKKDLADPTGKTTSSYVQDVIGRMGTRQPDSEAAVAVREWNAHQIALKEREANLASDPAAYVLKNRPDIAAQMQSEDPMTRARAVRALQLQQADLGVVTSQQKVLTKQMATMLASELTAGDADTATGTLRAVTTGLNAQQVQIVARQVAPHNAAFAAAIGASAQNPQLASEILSGERYLLQNKDANPVRKDIDTVMNATTAGSSSNSWFSSDVGGLFQFAPDAREQAIAATTALYARRTMGSKSGSGTFDKPTYQKAFADIAGQPISFRNQIIVAPREGMTASDMSDVMSHVDDKAIKRYGNGWPVDASGRPLTASDVSQHGVLTYTGAPGKYRVMFPGQGHLGVLHNPTSRTFILDLGAMVDGH